MSRWLRTAILALIIAAIAIASIAHATTWVFWVPAQDNSPSNATSATWDYWDGAPILYSTQSVTWILPYYVGFTGTSSVSGQPTGSSNYATWVALSSAYTLNGYAYQGVVGAYENVAIGSTYTFSTGYQYFVAVAWVSFSSETCGQLYFHADVENTATTTASFNAVFIIENATWSYVTFYSENVSPGSWFNPAVPGPNTCFLSNAYNTPSNSFAYLYIAVVAVNTTVTTVGTAQVSLGTTSEGTSAIPGTQYAWGNTPASGDTIVVPWTTYANPYVVTYFAQQVVNTAGSSAKGPFVVYLNNGAEFNLVTQNYAVMTPISYIVYLYDNDTGTFPNGTVVGYDCPANVYELPASVSPAVTKILSCQSLSSPSSGVAVYPTDYGRYAGAWTYNAPAGYLVNITYTDSAGNRYSWADYFAVSAPIYVYITTANGYEYVSVTTRQVTYPLQTNLTLFSINPTNQGILNQFMAGSEYTDVGSVLYFPEYKVYSNVVGETVTTGLPGAVGAYYGEISIVVWFYEPPGGMGALIGADDMPLPYTYGAVTKGLFIAPNGYLYYGDWFFCGGEGYAVSSAPVSPGWHMAVATESINNSGGTIMLYLDGNLVGTYSHNSPGCGPPFLAYGGEAFGTGVSYWYIGGNNFAGYISNVQAFYFNGTIAYVAIYNTILNSTQVQELYQAGFPNTLFSQNLVAAYLLTNTTYYVYDGVSHFYIKPYFANQQILSQLGISNASLITITPTGQVGWVPFTQWQQVTNYSVISYCKLMSYYTFNYLGGSKYQVVLVTNQNMNQFPLDYQFLITSGSGSQYVLPVYAYGNTNTFTNTTTATPPATAFLPVCDASPSTVPVAIETTAVTPVCTGNNVGYTTTNLEKLPNGTTYTYTLTYILGQNATTLPPALVPTPILAYPYVLMLAVLLIIAIAMYRFGDLGMRNSLILAGATAVVTVLAYLGVGNPYASFNLSCPNANAPVTVTVPLPQNIFLATTWLGIVAIILVIASLITEYSL